MVANIIPHDCRRLAGLSTSAKFEGDWGGWFVPVEASAAGGGGEIGGTSHVPKVAFAYSNVANTVSSCKTITLIVSYGINFVTLLC